MKFAILKNDNDMIELMERLRKNAFGFDADTINQYYINRLMDNSLVMLACVYNNKLIGGAYIANRFNKLYIESLFVDKSLQRSKLHVGTRIMNYIINNNELFDKLFDTKFYFSSLEPIDEEVASFYKRLGYHQNDNDSLILRKKLKKSNAVK